MSSQRILQSSASNYRGYTIFACCRTHIQDDHLLRRTFLLNTARPSKLATYSKQMHKSLFEMNSEEIWVRIDPPHPLVYRNRRLNGGGPSDETGKTEVRCHSRCGTIKIPPWPKAMNAEHRPKEGGRTRWLKSPALRHRTFKFSKSKQNCSIVKK
jgi:hypothetical protein